jgi:hypothetical protein
VSIDDHLYEKLVVCFREPKPPQKFDKELQEFDNLICYHSHSGMFNSELVVKFMETFCNDETVKPKSLILLDAWKGHNKAIEVAKKKHVVRIIPEKTTKYAQPEGLFFNRQFKSFLRKASDNIRMFYPNFTSAIRKNIASLLSMTMYQFSAVKFEPFLKFSWYKGGYIDEKLPFVTPPEFCFDVDPIEQNCIFKNCPERAFIICAHCEETICMKHAIVNQHRCT